MFFQLAVILLLGYTVSAQVASQGGPSPGLLQRACGDPGPGGSGGGHTHLSRRMPAVAPR